MANITEQKLKARIAQYEKEVKLEAERHIVRLTEDRSKLEERMADCEKFLSAGHITKIVKKRLAMLFQIDCTYMFIGDKLGFSEINILAGLDGYVTVELNSVNFVTKWPYEKK